MYVVKRLSPHDKMRLSQTSALITAPEDLDSNQPWFPIENNFSVVKYTTEKFRIRGMPDTPLEYILDYVRPDAPAATEYTAVREVVQKPNEVTGFIDVDFPAGSLMTVSLYVDALEAGKLKKKEWKVKHSGKNEQPLFVYYHEGQNIATGALFHRINIVYNQHRRNQWTCEWSRRWFDKE